MTNAIPLVDWLALAWFFACWCGYTFYADYWRWKTRELATVLHRYRVRWMQRMLKREARIADATIVATLIRSDTLFASTTLFILAGLVTILGALDKAREVVSTISFAVQASPELWEIKVLILITIFVYAFFKFAWSLRQFNFSLTLIGAAPMPDEVTAVDEREFPQRAATLITRAVASFNRGLRAYYFGLAMLSWFIQPWLLAVAAVWVVLVFYRREFHSVTLKTLADPIDDKAPAKTPPTSGA